MNADLHAIRTAAVLRQAQQRLDELSEPEPDEDTLTPDQALESAQHDVAATPYNAAVWLAEACDEATFPLDTYRLADIQSDAERDLSVPELLALILCGCDAEAQRARHELRERFDAAHRGFAEANAAAILAEQERELERMRGEAVDAREAA